MANERAVEICLNLKSTIKKMGKNTITTGNSSLSNQSIFSTPTASKASLERMLQRVMKKHNLTHMEISEFINKKVKEENE